MSLSANCSPDEFTAFALEVEQETQRVLAEIHDCLSERGERLLASFLREFASPSADGPPEGGNPGRAQYRLAFGIPDARKLLEVALEAKRQAWTAFDGAARTARDPEVRGLAATLAGVEAEDLRRLARAVEGVTPAANWEALVEQGTVPSLALGAERRMRRAPGGRGGGQNPPVT